MNKVTLKKIEEILKTNFVNLKDNLTEISGFEINSQKIVKNNIFIAIKGTNSDGHNYIKDAIKAGAIAIITEKDIHENVPYLKVVDTKEAINKIFREISSFNSLKISAVTGTNGKTTIHWLQSEILENLNNSTTKIGTFGIINKKFKTKTNLTTPDIISTYKALENSIKENTNYIFMEVSSHALEQKRVDFIDFDLMVFTNLTQDHLDYHKTMDDYFNSKKLLFRKNNKNSTAIINIDCEYGLKIKDFCLNQKIKTYSYGFNSNADFLINDYKKTNYGSSFTITFNSKTYKIESNFFARYNALNLTASIISAFSLNFTLENIISILSKIKPVPGRLEKVSNKKPLVLVDYAHTPDALENVAKEIKNKEQKLWIIFGCGGDRDKSKRVLMAEAADKHADHLIITSDNPRTEDPQQIIQDILKANINPPFLVEADRSLAIKETILNANPDDIILIAGKGHEDYQILKDKTIYFSDRDEALKSLKTCA